MFVIKFFLMVYNAVLSVSVLPLFPESTPQLQYKCLFIYIKHKVDLAYAHLNKLSKLTCLIMLFTFFDLV